MLGGSRACTTCNEKDEVGTIDYISCSHDAAIRANYACIQGVISSKATLAAHGCANWNIE